MRYKNLTTFKYEILNSHVEYLLGYCLEEHQDKVVDCVNFIKDCDKLLEELPNVLTEEDTKSQNYTDFRVRFVGYKGIAYKLHKQGYHSFDNAIDIIVSKEFYKQHDCDSDIRCIQTYNLLVTLSEIYKDLVIAEAYNKYVKDKDPIDIDKELQESLRVYNDFIMDESGKLYAYCFEEYMQTKEQVKE